MMNDYPRTTRWGLIDTKEHFRPAGSGQYDKVVLVEIARLKTEIIDGHNEDEFDKSPSKKKKVVEDAMSVGSSAVCHEVPILASAAPTASISEAVEANSYTKFDNDLEMDWVDDVDWEEQHQIWEETGNPAGRSGPSVKNPIIVVFANMQTMSNYT